MHVVLGAGNLGCSLTEELMVRNIPVTLFSTAVNDWKYPKSLTKIFELEPSHIWVCIGGDQANRVAAYDTAIRLPLEIMEYSDNNIHLHFFQNESPYTQNQYLIRKSIRSLFSDRDTTYPSKKITVHNISLLYGRYKPQRCLPFQILKNTFRKNQIEFPVDITPTPTDWAAKKLIDEHLEYKNGFSRVSPSGDIGILDFHDLLKDPNSILWTGNKESQTRTNPSWLDLWVDRNDFWRKLQHAGHQDR